MSTTAEKKLQGLNVVYFESRHSKTMGDLIALQGGTPFAARAMKEVPIENNPEAFEFAEKLFRNEIDALVLLTGAGTRALVSVLETRYPREKILDSLKKIAIVPRGPKPIRVLNEWGVPFALTVPEPNTWREVLLALDDAAGTPQAVPIGGKTVAVQEYGVSNPAFLDALRERKARVLRVPVYRWALPDDLTPLKTAVLKIISGEIQVAVFTTAVQIEHLFEVARQMGPAAHETLLRDAFKKIAVASVGPDCSEALRNRGLSVDIEPETHKMAPLVTATAERAKRILEQKTQLARLPARQAAGPPAGEAWQPAANSLQESVFLKACRREKTPYTPVWLMRQAGRYMKDYRNIREKVSFLELCKNVPLAAEVTVHAQEKLKTDAAIIFSDILLILEPMGLSLEYLKGDGPCIKNAVHDSKSVEAVKELGSVEALSFVFEAIRETRKKLKPTIPLIGFAGAPFTLASYMIEGGSTKDFTKTKKFMQEDGSRWRHLMRKIVRSTILYLNAQISAGAQAVQIFDSWAGALNGQEYEKFAAPHTAELIQGLQKGTPVIHFGTKTGDFLDKISQAGGDVIGVDHRIALDKAWKTIGYDKAIQGNLDPKILCGDLREIKIHTQRILKEAGGRPGHIFNLGHGVLPETPVENAVAVVEMVHELSQR